MSREIDERVLAGAFVSACMPNGMHCQRNSEVGGGRLAKVWATGSPLFEKVQEVTRRPVNQAVRCLRLFGRRREWVDSALTREKLERSVIDLAVRQDAFVPGQSMGYVKGCRPLRGTQRSGFKITMERLGTRWDGTGPNGLAASVLAICGRPSLLAVDKILSEAGNHEI